MPSRWGLSKSSRPPEFCARAGASLAQNAVLYVSQRAAHGPVGSKREGRSLGHVSRNQSGGEDGVKVIGISGFVDEAIPANCDELIDRR